MRGGRTDRLRRERTPWGADGTPFSVRGSSLGRIGVPAWLLAAPVPEVTIRAEVTVASAGRDFDVVIVGGGPAGSMTGGMLARKGRSACLLEREEFPRFHIGESMLAQSLGVLSRAGALERVVKAGFVRK